jgi:hypothetical protein
MARRHKNLDHVVRQTTPPGLNGQVHHQGSPEFSRLGLAFDGLWGRPLHAIDCQGLFCETDKYCREAAPELASARKRIKARFNRSTEPVQLFFPPKWGINDRLPEAPVLGVAVGEPIVQPALF